MFHFLERYICFAPAAIAASVVEVGRRGAVLVLVAVGATATAAASTTAAASAHHLHLFPDNAELGPFLAVGLPLIQLQPTLDKNRQISVTCSTI